MSFKPAIASLSLGRAWLHELPPKFSAASASGLPGIEIFFEDLAYLAASLPGGPTPANHLHAAHQIRSLCDSLSLEIMGLGPFSDCEGLLCPIARAAKLQELYLWFDMARILGTDIIQIPSTFRSEGLTGDMEKIVTDLREIADLGKAQSPPFRFAYENLCFATYNDTWEKAWAVVKGVDRENFGLCLDTFNIAGRGWADPASLDGKLPNADAVFRQSLKNMVKEIDVKKIFYVQVVDAERMSAPLDERHPFFVEGQRPRMSWSRNARLFICEEERGGYLPVVDVLKAITDEKNGLGYKGWISMEFFNRSLTKEEANVPKDHARRAVESWKKLVKVMGWEDKVEPIVPKD
ncbi:putative 3-dehydroshikimate dehydratase [Tricladium varicosporioides]|nr:putative 3-dehydroshikimate dehydratase [Hymenoscyphus varicosporioides]